MQFRKGHGELSVIEAVDNLSNMAELNLPIPEEKAAQEERTKIRSASKCTRSHGAIRLTTLITAAGQRYFPHCSQIHARAVRKRQRTARDVEHRD